MADIRPESWYVQELIDNIRVPHNITPDMSYMEAVAEFLNFASVVSDAYAVADFGLIGLPASVPAKTLTIANGGGGVKMDSSIVHLEVGVLFNMPALSTSSPTLNITSQ